MCGGIVFYLLPHCCHLLLLLHHCCRLRLVCQEGTLHRPTCPTCWLLLQLQLFHLLLCLLQLLWPVLQRLLP